MPLAGWRFSLQLISELPLCGFPVHKLLCTRLNEPISFSQNVAVPCRRRNVLARQCSPKVFHQAQLVRRAHLLKVNRCRHLKPVAERGFVRKLECSAGGARRLPASPDSPRPVESPECHYARNMAPCTNTLTDSAQPVTPADPPENSGSVADSIWGDFASSPHRPRHLRSRLRGKI